MRRAFEPFPTISIVVPVDLKLTDFIVRSHTSCARVPVAYIKLNKTMSLKPVSLFWSGSARMNILVPHKNIHQTLHQHSILVCADLQRFLL